VPDLLIPAARLNARQWRLALNAAVLLTLIPLQLRLLPFSRMIAGLDPEADDTAEAGSIEPGSAEQARANEIGWVVNAVGRRLPWQPRCLARAITQQRMLQAKGIAGQLLLGVNRDKEDGELSAHAWVCCAGEEIGGSGSAESYAVINSYCWGG
jgi:hypothetical protein